MKLDKMMLFALSTNKELVDKVAQRLNIPSSEVVLKHFANGEVIVYPEESVRSKHVFVVQSTCQPVSEKLMELLVFIDALKRASAREITAVIPFFGFARQDRKALPRQPITARLVADLLQCAGANRIISFDFHTPQLQGFFSCPTDNVAVKKLFFNELKHLSGPDTVVVSPDHGGVSRAQELASLLKSNLVILDKRRPADNKATIINIIGDVRGKNCIIVDDMIDTGGTIIAGTQALLNAGAKDIYVCATHGIFSSNAMEILQNSPIKQVIVTDTIPLTKTFGKLKVVSVTELMAKVVENIELGISLSTIY